MYTPESIATKNGSIEIDNSSSTTRVHMYTCVHARGCKLRIKIIKINNKYRTYVVPGVHVQKYIYLNVGHK